MGDLRKNAEKAKALTAIRGHLLALRDEMPNSADDTGVAAQTIRKILDSARDNFTAFGYSGLSMRKVASDANISVGNLTYHFPTKRKLIDAILKDALGDFIAAHLEQIDEVEDEPLDMLLNVVEFYVTNAHSSHKFFYQLWGYAGFDDDSRETVRALYKPIGRFVYYLVRAANPKLNDAEIRRATLQIFSLEEGYKLFIGLTPEGGGALDNATEDFRMLAKRLIMDP
ncbi:MAG: TetR/AcrR family transcriptional regulator [Marinicaulis sp.]|nr:TetR/AcrR family transcriptional regulator [Marinicaulis sp.]NNE41069.1 TetR/AcrR family transcriptional regulator [Marinicaulis sp.]NNL88263.1 TetR/AcrR family transcriptional regulator [Marinicaulis sp.]